MVKVAPRRLRVLLTTEGTYPHTMGGVSTWCQILIEQLPDVDFTVFAHMMNPFLPEAYTRPANADLIQVPIWGVEEPAEFNPKMSPRRVLMLSALMNEETARRDFCPLLKPMLEMITDPSRFDPEIFGQILYDMYLYFQNHDYRGTFRTRAVWELFRETVLLSYGLDPRDEAWEDVDPESEPSPQEIVQRFQQLRKGGSKVDPELTKSHRVPRLFEATEAMRVMYRLLTPLNYELPDTDVVHATAASFCGMPGVIKKIESGTPFLVTEHGVYMREQMLFLGRIGFPYHLRRFFIQFVSAISRTVYHYADQVSPVCSYNARWERKNGATEEQIKVIYNGVDPERFRPRSGKRPTKPTVVMVSRVDPLKDLETSLRVAAAVRERIPNVQFLHFGPAPDAKYQAQCLKLWKELQLKDTFKWKGSTRDVAGAFNSGDVCLLTSISEAFPYTVIEAMMCGVPVVSTNVGGVSEAVDDLGITTRIRDVDALAEGVVKMLQLDDSARQELANACRDRTLELFTIDDSIKAYRQSYHELPERAQRRTHRTPAATLPSVTLAPVPPVADFPALPAVPLSTQPAAAIFTPDRDTAAARDDDNAVIFDLTQPPHGHILPSAASTKNVDPVPAKLRVTTSDDVLALLAAKESQKRLAAIGAYHLLPTNDAVAQLSRILRADPDPQVRMAAADALGEMIAEEKVVG